jgi:hypothetical protein
MKLRNLFVVVGLAVGLAAGAPSAHAAKGVKKKNEHLVNGTVVRVEHKDQHEGEITVKVHHHKKKSQPGHGHERRFHVHRNTQFIARHGDKEHVTHFAAVKQGEHVTVHAKAHHAEMVVIHHHHHKKAGNPAANPAAKIPVAVKKAGKK